MGEYWNISAFMFMFRRKIISPTVWPVAFLPLCFLLHRHEGFKPETFLTFSNDLCTSQKPDEINASKSLVKWHIGSNWEACAKKTHLLGEPCFVVAVAFFQEGKQWIYAGKLGIIWVLLYFEGSCTFLEYCSVMALLILMWHITCWDRKGAHKELKRAWKKCEWEFFPTLWK